MEHNKNNNSNVPNLRFPEFSGEWEKGRFNNYITLLRGSSPRPIQEYLTKNDDGVNWIKIGDTKNVLNYRISQVEEKITPAGATKSREVYTGDLILANSMSFGKTYELGINGCIYDGWFVLRNYAEHFHKPFLLQLLNSEYMQGQYRRLSAGGIVQNISSEIVYETILSRPTLPEQQKVASLLSLIDERITTQIKIIEELESLVKGLYSYILDGLLSDQHIGDICDIKKGQQLNKINLSSSGQYYVMNGGITPSGYYDKYNTPADTISISEGGNSCGYVQYNDTPFWSGGHCYTLENIDNSVNKKYLYHYLKSNESRIMELRVGSGLPNIQKQILSAFCVPIPPVDEQCQIAEAFDALTEKINIQRDILSAHQKQKAYLLHEMFI